MTIEEKKHITQLNQLCIDTGVRTPENVCSLCALAETCTRDIDENFLWDDYLEKVNNACHDAGHRIIGSVCDHCLWAPNCLYENDTVLYEPPYNYMKGC